MSNDASMNDNFVERLKNYQLSLILLIYLQQRNGKQADSWKYIVQSKIKKITGKNRKLLKKT